MRFFDHLGFERMELHSRVFFVKSCFAASLFFLSSCLFVELHGLCVYIPSSLVLLYFALVAKFTKRELTIRYYNIRYEITIYLGMLVTTTSMFFIDDIFVMFVPVLLGVLYTSANTFIKSKRVAVASAVFMFEPIVKLLSMKSNVPLGYTAVMVLCIVVVLISDNLFKSTAQARDESEHKLVLMRSVFKFMHGMKSHDLRNLASRFPVLMLPEYMNDPIKFSEKLFELISELDTLASFKLFEMPEPVNLRKMLTSIPCVQDNTDRFVFDIWEPRITANKHVLHTVLKNVIENAMEAATRKQIIPVIEIQQYDDTITVTDNCGGFDVHGIKNMYSSKGKHGHGVFLNMITDPAIGVMFGMTVSVARVHHGTCVTINYNKHVEHI